MIVTGNWLQAQATQRICALLTDAGFQALFVGGCVRNDLLKMSVTDIDIATDARPEKVMQLAQSANIRAIPTGISHGTITLIGDGKPHEITTFRRDIATDGRRAVVAFATDPLEDARRRDFTINALYASPDGTVIDPLHGLPDLLARKVRFIGDPDQRIHEDYLRILRFFRFQAWFGNPDQTIDLAGLAACKRNLSGLKTLSRERVGMEMRKLFSAPDPAPATAAMAQSGVLSSLLAGSETSTLAALVALEQAHEIPPRWQRRLAALGGAAAETSMRLSRFEGRELATLQAAIASPETPRQLAQRFGESAAVDAVLINSARSGFDLPDDLRELARSGASERFPISAADLFGIVPAGPEMGHRLELLRAVWIASDMALSRAQLLSDIARPN